MTMTFDPLEHLASVDDDVLVHLAAIHQLAASMTPEEHQAAQLMLGSICAGLALTAPDAALKGAGLINACSQVLSAMAEKAVA